MKKFYKLVATQKASSGHLVLLDGKPIKTPARQDLCAPNEHIATLIQHEWASQEDEINPNFMPVTQLLSTCIDRVTPNRAEIENDTLAYIDTDLLYFHTANPPQLAREQEKLWGVWLEKLSPELGPLPKPVVGLSVEELHPDTKKKAKRFIADCSDLTLTLFAHLTNMSGSFLLSYAYVKGLINRDDFVRASLCEELFYVDFYGTIHNGLDPQLEAKKTALEKDLETATLILHSKH